jgi:hypothetical protein
MKSETIIYSLTVEDVQTVAMETMNRELTEAEINSLIDPIGDRLAWFDAVENVIRCCFESEVDKYDEIN